MPDPLDRSQEPQPLSMTFHLSHLVVGHAYPATEVCAEIGRVTVAAARVDRAFALVLLAVQPPEPFDALLTWSSLLLRKELHRHLLLLFDEPLLSNALAIIDSAYAAIQQRHAVAHTVWTLEGRAAAVSVDELSRATTPEELDALMRRDVPSEGWRTLHPKAQGPAPTLTSEIGAIRARLEDSNLSLRVEAQTLASALFAGKPRGAKHILDPATMRPA